MKRYNEKLLAASKKISQDALKKSKNTTNRLTHPSRKTARTGSYIGLIAGSGLIIVGIAGTIFSHLWGLWSCLGGVVTIISNILNLNKYK